MAKFKATYTVEFELDEQEMDMHYETTNPDEVVMLEEKNINPLEVLYILSDGYASKVEYKVEVVKE